MSDLTDFLLARIAEDEEEWQPRNGATCDCEALGHVNHHSAYCARRLLAECEAKRRIVALHVVGGSLRGPVTDNKFYCCDLCGPQSWPYVQDPSTPGIKGYHEAPEPEGEFWPCETLRLLALPYADHQDYRQEWRP